MKVVRTGRRPQDAVIWAVVSRRVCVALDVLKGHRVDDRQIPLNRESYIQTQLIRFKGRIIQVQNKINIAAAGNYPPL